MDDRDRPGRNGASNEAVRKGKGMEYILEMRMATVAELQKILDVGQGTAYNLVRRKDFPSVKLGREYRVMVDKLEEWIAKQQRNK